jgi:hypothetical protein
LPGGKAVPRRICTAYGHASAATQSLAARISERRHERLCAGVDLIPHLPRYERWSRPQHDHRQQRDYDQRFDKRKSAARRRSDCMLFHLHS